MYYIYNTGIQHHLVIRRTNIITKVSLFGDIIQSSADSQCCNVRQLQNIWHNQKANPDNNKSRENFCSAGGWDDDEYNDVGFVQISWIISMQGAYFFGNILFDKVQLWKTFAYFEHLHDLYHIIVFKLIKMLVDKQETIQEGQVWIFLPVNTPFQFARSMHRETENYSE